jgi:hypothetical protein
MLSLSPASRRLRPCVAPALSLIVALAIFPAPAARAALDHATSGPIVEQPIHEFGAAEAFRNLGYARQAGIGWDRLVFSWQYIQPEGPTSWNAEHYLSYPSFTPGQLVGMDFVGILQDTPRWAALDPGLGARSAPRGLEFPPDDASNYWASFAHRTAAEYSDRVSAWIIWNEPEFRAADQGGMYVTWEGGDEAYYQLLKSSYRAIKAANPRARVLFAATSFWIEATNGRTSFLERILSLADRDPEARGNGYFFDAVPLNIYWSPDDLEGIARITRATLARHGLQKPLWIVETNAMPYDDPAAPKSFDGQRVTMREQASFVIQSLAIGLASGYERIGWHAMIDRDTSDEIWGLVRNDGSPRPALWAYQTASLYLGGADWVRAAHLARPRHRVGIPAGDPDREIYQVVAQKGTRRVSVLWNADPTPRLISLPRLATSALVVDQRGSTRQAVARGGAWDLLLPAASARRSRDAEDVFVIGGEPLLLVQYGVPPETPIGPPNLVSH